MQAAHTSAEQRPEGDGTILADALKCIELLNEDLAKLGVRVRWNGRRYEIVLPGTEASRMAE